MPSYVVVHRNVKSRNIVPNSRLTRIVVPQNIFKDISIRQRSNVNKAYLKTSSWWWTQHRKYLSKHMPKIGEDIRELRAIPHSLVKGSLPERIVYLWLIMAHFVPGADFDFQSSSQGGRLELGGIVADFLFQSKKLVIQVQGPTHDSYLRIRKDEEQRQILEAMGYQVIYLDDDLIYDEARFEEEMRGIFNMSPTFGAGSMGSYIWAGQEDEVAASLVNISDSATQLLQLLAEALEKIG